MEILDTKQGTKKNKKMEFTPKKERGKKIYSLLAKLIAFKEESNTS